MLNLNNNLASFQQDGTAYSESTFGKVNRNELFDNEETDLSLDLIDDSK